MKHKHDEELLRKEQSAAMALELQQQRSDPQIQ